MSKRYDSKGEAVGEENMEDIEPRLSGYLAALKDKQVVIHLINGTSLEGILKWFDADALLLQLAGPSEIVVMHHAIMTIQGGRGDEQSERSMIASEEKSTEDELSERVKRAAESILEDESLTTDLDDAAAEELLKWGVDSVKRILQNSSGLDSVEAEAAISSRLQSLRRLMRLVNKWASDPTRGAMDTQDNVAFLDRILEQAIAVYGSDWMPPVSEQRDRLLKLQVELAQTPAKMIARLRKLIEGPSGDLSMWGEK